MQDWVVLNGVANASLIQGESNWLDCTQIQDLSFWLDLRNVTGTATLYYETSPSKDDGLFQPMVAGITLVTPAAAAVVMTNAMSGSALVPPAKWVRWRLGAGAGTFATTFRLYVTGNRVGVG